MSGNCNDSEMKMLERVESDEAPIYTLGTVLEYMVHCNRMVFCV